MIVSINERISAVHVGLPWRGLFPIPDGTLNGNDRAHVATFFGADFTPLITSTERLQMPVDCVLAGNQTDENGRSALDTRKGHAHYRALRGIFRE